jgi:endosialidase-like protein
MRWIAVCGRGSTTPATAATMKSTMKIKVTLLILVILALSQIAQAINPAPDGGYPGGNTAEGQNALSSLSTSTYNTAVGLFSLKSNTGGSFNTGVGAGALLLNVGDQTTGAGVENTAIGAGALLSNTTGCCNTANGAFALFNLTNAAENSAFGNSALMSNTEANDNSAFGFDALASDTGAGNTAVGAYSLLSNTTGVLNTAVGLSALGGHAAGDSNIALGFAAGSNVTTGSNVICIGSGGANVSDSCFIGTPGVHANTYIAGIYGAPISGATATAVYIDSDGKLGTVFSSARFKDEIKPMDSASEAILGLKPVTFRYKREIDPTGTPQFGLVAEQVEKVNPALVVRDKEGKPYSVRYEQVNAMLLNEFLKEHEMVEELKSTAAKQEEQIRSLTSALQKVSAQIEANKFARRTAGRIRRGGQTPQIASRDP